MKGHPRVAPSGRCAAGLGTRERSAELISATQFDPPFVLPLFEQVAESCSHWRAESVGFWRTVQGSYWMPRLVFSRPGEEPTINSRSLQAFMGTNPLARRRCVISFARSKRLPSLARQYLIHLYPLSNPNRYEDGTRCSRSGKDLNREFWRGSTEPEVQLLERDDPASRYDGLISLHSDDTSEGFYGFVRGRVD
jgi:hypothetical protein